jgi:4-hydroxy-2-oxoglutarate aldolase
MTATLEGIYAPITTPFENQEVSLVQLKENMEKYSQSALTGYFALGSNGESKSMTEKEKLTVLETVLAGKADHQKVMAGGGYESTRQTIDFCKQVAELGADFVSIVTPSYLKKGLTDEALAGHYTAVAEAIPIPVIIYNAPGFTGMTVSPGLVEKVTGHPNIIGMKDSSKGNMAGYIAAADDSFNIMAGTVSTLFQSLAIGATGGVVSLGNAFPEPCCQLYQKCMAGDTDGALELHWMLYNLNKKVSGSFGVAGVKYAMELGGFHGGDPRLPLLPITEAGKDSIRAGVKAAGLI